MQCKSKLRMMVTLTLMACTLGSTGTVAQQTSTRTERNSGKEEWMMNTSENGRGLQVRIKGKVEFNEDYSDIKSLAPNGSVRVRDTRTTPGHRLEIEADDNGGLKRSYFVNDNAQAFDAEGRQWMAAVMLEMVRQGGYDAERRVARLFAQGARMPC